METSAKETKRTAIHRSRTPLLAVLMVAFTLCAPVATHAARVPDAAPTDVVAANTALALQFHHEIFERGNLAAADHILAPDFVWHYPADAPFAVGPEAVKQQAAALRAFYPDLTWTDDDVIASGDRVVIRWTMRGRGQARGEAWSAPLTVVTGIDIFRVADGRLVDLWQNFEELGDQQASAMPGTFLP